MKPKVELSDKRKAEIFEKLMDAFFINRTYSEAVSDLYNYYDVTKEELKIITGDDDVEEHIVENEMEM